MPEIHASEIETTEQVDAVMAGLRKRKRDLKEVEWQRTVLLPQIVRKLDALHEQRQALVIAIDAAEQAVAGIEKGSIVDYRVRAKPKRKLKTDKQGAKASRPSLLDSPDVKGIHPTGTAVGQ